MTIRRAWIAMPVFISVFTAVCFAGASASEAEVSNEAVASSHGGALAPCAWRRSFPPPQHELPITITPDGDRFAVWTPTIGFLRDPVDLPLFLPTECDVSTRIDPDAFGYAVTYRVRNLTEVSQELPTLQIPGNLLDPVIDNLDHRIGSEWETFDATDGTQFSSRKAPYPLSLYSPVIVVRDHRFAVGFALLYDVMGYKHDIRTNVYRGPSGSPYADRWTARFYLDGTIEPGESRSYRLDVYYNEPEDWIYTLRSYRGFLRKAYGDVHYRQDMRPVWMQQLGDTNRLRSNNKRGFGYYRADLNGFTREVDAQLAYMLGAGYKRVMVRTLAGVYYQNQQNNFPPQITTEWTPPMMLTGPEWRRLGEAGIDLHFWWGRSGQVADRWEDDELEDFDPDNPAHAARMIREWQNAIFIGAAGLGLDKFTVLPPWQALQWLDTLRSLKADAFFVAEPAAYDILHLYIPTYLTSVAVAQQPHLLADYLVPGRELWVQLEGEDNTLERALQLIANGMTVVTSSMEFGADDMMEAVREAQGCGNPPE